MDPDHTGSTLFVNEASNILVDDKKHAFCDYALKRLIISVYTVRIFMKCTLVCEAQTTY